MPLPAFRTATPPTLAPMPPRLAALAISLCITGGCSRGAAQDHALPPIQAPAHPAVEPNARDAAPTEAAPAPAEPAPPEPAPVGYTTCTPDGLRAVPPEELPPQAAGERWFVPAEHSTANGTFLKIVPTTDAPPSMLETMDNLQKATAADAELVCRVFAAGVTGGSRSADATGRVVDASWGRTCQVELVRADREGWRGKITVMRGGAEYLMVMSTFAADDTVTAAAHDQLIGCWAEARP